MRPEIVKRRRETALLLTSGVVLAFFVSALASVVVSAAWPAWPRTAVVVSACGVLSAVALLFFAILSRKEQILTHAEMVLCFDRATSRFIDVPFSPASINARVTFDDLPRSRQIELGAFDRYEKFFESEFEHSVHDLVQKILLFSLFQDPFDPAVPGKRVMVDALPESLKRNACIRAHSRKDPDHGLRIPEWVTVDTFGPFERFLRFVSNVGKLELSWSIGYSTAAGATRLYWDAVGIDRTQRHDFFVDVQLLYEYHHVKMHSKRLEDFAVWANHIAKQLRDFDWSFTREHLPLVILSELGSKLAARSGE